MVLARGESELAVEFRQPAATATPHSHRGIRSEVLREFNIEIASDLQAFEHFWPSLGDLEGLAHARAYPFQCRDHLEIWLETIGKASGFHPVLVNVATKNGTPLMLIPLGMRRSAGLRFLEFLDAGVSDYNAPVLLRPTEQPSPAEARAIWKKIRCALPPFDVAVLRKMPQRVAEFPNPLHGLATDPWPDSGHQIMIAGSDLAALQPKSQRADNRRKRAQLEKFGTVETRIASGEGEIRRVFAAFAQQKTRQIGETSGKDSFNVPAQAEYYLTLTERLSGRGVHLFYLAVGDAIAATCWCFVAGRRFYYMMPAYDRGELQKRSPGRILLDDLVAWAHGNHIEVFDFGIGDEEYKFRWKQEPLALAGLVEPRTAAGHLYASAMRLRRLMKKQLPAPVVQILKRGLTLPKPSYALGKT